MHDTTFLILRTLFLDRNLVLKSNLGTNMRPSHPTSDSIFQLVQVTVIQLVDGVTAFANCDNQIAPTVAYLSATAKYFPPSLFKVFKVNIYLISKEISLGPQASTLC